VSVLLTAVAAAAALSCARGAPPPRGAAEPPAAPASPRAAAGPQGVPRATGTLPVPPETAPSGVLFRVGLKSDVTELSFGPPGRRWIVSAGGRAELLRGSLKIRPEGKRSVSFQVQAGAYSQEGPARELVDRLAAQTGTAGSVAFSADRGVYRALLGAFPDRAAADAFAERLRASGQDAFTVEGSTVAESDGAAISLSGEDGASRRLPSPIRISAEPADGPIVWDGKPYRGSVAILVNARGTLNVVNRIDMEEYLYGVVPAEMGPKRYDELESLKAQAVAARTYAFAHRGQFDAEGYDLCATPKCQVYAGLSAEDPLSTAAVDATRGLALGYDGRFADALFISTCGGRTENVENVFGETPVPYLVGVDCGELSTISLAGAALDRRAAPRERTGLEWRGYALERHFGKRRPTRADILSLAQNWAGVARAGAPPASLAASAVYPSLIAAFGLGEARGVHLGSREADYYQEAPALSGRLAAAALEAYEFLFRFRFGAGEPLPPPDRTLTEEEYSGLLLSAALRTAAVSEGSGRFLSRDGSNVWVKTSEGRVGLPVDPELPLARRAGDRYLPAPSLTLRAGDHLRWWKRGASVLALWVETDAAGPTFERDSSWTEWVRRVPARELARRMAGRVAGTEVREITVTRRSSSGRAIEMRVVTDAAQIVLKRFDLRQAVEMPDMLFTVEKVRGPQGDAEFLFLGRGWGHGVGLCQNGAWGMAIAGATYDQILAHYYTGIQIVQASTLSAGPPSTR
jgi:peptidoglycan hydrolase-like amidase